VTAISLPAVLPLLFYYALARHEKNILKEQCHEIFDFGFFHESVSPKPLSIQLGPFQIFCENSLKYLQAKVHHSRNLRARASGTDVCAEYTSQELVHALSIRVRY
jgi:hypothetical protein